MRGTKCERDKQQKPWRKVTLEQATSSSISSINEFLGRGEDSLMDEILDAGINWIPRDILSSTVNKAISLTAKPGGVTLQSKRNKGGINYSKAITFWMPEGRRRKGEKAPRKKGKKKAETSTSVVSPIADSIPTPPAESSQSNIQHPLPIHQPIFPRQSVQQSSAYNPHHTEPRFTFGSSLEEPINPTVFQQQVPPFSPYFQRLSSLQPNISEQAFIPAPIPQSTAGDALSYRTSTPSNQLNQPRLQLRHGTAFPTPNVGQFFIYLLKFCPGQTSMCFGCGNPIKQKNTVVEVPNDLVIVSKMLTEWSYQRTAQSKMANVYFHCKSSCVVKKQADFDRRLCSIPPQIEPHLVELHRAYLRRNFGI